jgi:mono/diheme cytochrome c family protein
MKFLPFLLVLVACGDSAANDRVATIVGLTGDATAGEVIYTSNCSGCHGADATGGSGPNLIDAYAEGADEEMITTILNGEESMPAFDSLADQDIADAWAYIGSL